MGRFLEGVIRFKGGICDGGDLVDLIVLKQVAIDRNDRHRLLCECPQPQSDPTTLCGRVRNWQRPSWCLLLLWI